MDFCDILYWTTSDLGLEVTKRSLVQLSKLTPQSAVWQECPTRVVTPANEEQRALSLVATHQPVTLRAQHRGKGLGEPEQVQKQGEDKVGWHAPQALTYT